MLYLLIRAKGYHGTWSERSYTKSGCLLIWRGGNEEKGKLPIPLKVTLVFTNRIGISNLSRGWASWWARVHTRKLLGLQFACVSIKMQVAAVFLSRGKVSPRAGRPKSRWGNCRACTSRRVSTPEASCPKHDMLSFRVSRSHAVGTFRLSAVFLDHSSSSSSSFSSSSSSSSSSSPPFIDQSS